MATDIQVERAFKKDAVLKAWEECDRAAKDRGEKQGNMSEFVSTFKGDYKGTEFTTNISSLRSWLGLVDRKASGVRVHSTPSKTVVVSTSATLDDVEAEYKRSIEALIVNLEKQQHNLKQQLNRVADDLARARVKLTKFD